MTNSFSLQALIEAVQREAPSDSPLDQLAAASTTAARITETGDALLDHYVGRCREAGNSWAQISGVLGVTKQAVHKRFRPGQLRRWVPRARAALDKAAQLARKHDHPYLGTEHLLLGLLSDPTAISARVASAAGLTYDAVSARVFDGTTPSAQVTDEEIRDDEATDAGGGLKEFFDTIGATPLDIQPPLHPHTKRAFVMALSEALRLGHNYIGTEHLLLSLHHVPDALAAQILTDAGLDLETARQRVADDIVQISERGRK